MHFQGHLIPDWCECMGFTQLVGIEVGFIGGLARGGGGGREDETIIL